MSTTVTVNSVAALNSALASSQAGETIKLAAGTYSGVSINQYSRGQVTITSADPNHHAVITGLKVANSSGVSFSGVDFSFAAASTSK